ncbi:UNVERIFIED_ORG: general secretion pathway protein B [Zoogloea ramigera]|uniref:General secretion pathway protein GspB n=1 Tax=Duganella zoogloeoides TaxID=75659 RepID=A0ABZ0XUG7_9BURK|nr:general secretion pathway protein GspB [Duganella zoogloeoides]WQH03373.1 general secretion pathway protein GspB [Duganella zoogloeoides]
MSYILEALKKAQAERQLGSSPTIHAPTLQAGAHTAASGRLKRPVMLALVAMAVVIVVLLVLMLRPASLVAPAVSSAPAAPAMPAGSVDAVASTPQQPVPAPQLPAALPEPVTALPPPVATVTTPLAQPSTSPEKSATALAQQSTPLARPSTPAAASMASPAPAAMPAPATAARGEEPVLNLRELPEPIQRAIPPVTVGGYIYSRNAADRLLLVDKILRREGEEVAPGLLLEKLNPKEAVFNYKGYRYRVPY